jgi:hypothetical protein
MLPTSLPRALLPPSSQSAAAPVGSVVELQGTATVTRNGANTPLKVGDAILMDDVLRTDANTSLTIRFSDGSMLNLKSNAQIVVDRFTVPSGAAQARRPAANANDAAPPMPPPQEAFVAPWWLTAGVLALPILPLGWWLVHRRSRFKDYLRRRTPERPPLVHELVVRASEALALEYGLLTRAALQLGRSREGTSRSIDVEATVAATARAAGVPTVRLERLRSSPEYLVLISTQGMDDHSAHRLDRLAAELAAQNLSLTRYFIAHDANLCYATPDGPYLRLGDLAAQFEDHRLIFLGTGDQLLKPRTLAPWAWAEDLAHWKRRAILTPRPFEEWGVPEIALARLFDAPPLGATSAGLLRLAEFFERSDPPDPEQFRIDHEAIRRSWTLRPGRWLTPVPQDDASYAALSGELRSYFVDQLRHFDTPAFWWLAACAVYPAVRWDLTVYLGLKLHTAAPADATHAGPPLYSEERALRLAELPWFREGFMPNWLRARLIAELPPDVHAQAGKLLHDLLERAIHPAGQSFDTVRLRIAQDDPDAGAVRPERDEIFLDALAQADPLALKAPRSLRELLAGFRHSFIAQEWTAVITFVLYWLVLALLAPWHADGALTAGVWLPLAALPLVLVTYRWAAPAARWVQRSVQSLLRGSGTQAAGR